MLFLKSILLLSSLVASDPTQYWHDRYHGLLSMAAYGDWQTLCPLTFTQSTLLKSFPNSKEEPFTILSEWGPTASGISGFNVMIPEMDKVVMVFKGFTGWELTTNMTSGSLLAAGIANSTAAKAHQGAITAYLEAKAATNDWAIVKQYVASTGHQWSISGHAFGGMVAQVAALDLGWRGLSHWTHSQGSPRVFNPAAANIYNNLYQGEASQRTVANQDSVPTIIPESDDYTFVLEGFHIYGTNVTYGMNYDVCQLSPTDPNCLGGNNFTDNAFYYTPIGFCGGSQVAYNFNEQNNYEISASSAFLATAGTVALRSTTSTTSSSTSSTSSSSTSSIPQQSTFVVIATQTAAPLPQAPSAVNANVAPTSTNTNSGSSSLGGRGVLGGLAIGLGIWLL